MFFGDVHLIGNPLRIRHYENVFQNYDGYIQGYADRGHSLMILTIIHFIPSTTSGNDPIYQVLIQQLDYRQKHILIIILIYQKYHMEYFIKL